MATVSHYAMRRYPVGPVDGNNQLAPGQYYVASTNQQLSPMYDKSKKTWSQRLNITKAEKNSPPPISELPDFSPGALSRSMKYAEPWLYGTVRGIPARSIHHHGQPIFAPLPAELAVVVCSCPEYYNGTKKEVKKASICKKCKGSRLPLAQIGGTVRIQSTSAPIVHKARGSAGTVRLPTSIKSRPTILDPQNDPYDLMRRSRLLSPEPKVVTKPVDKNLRNRAKSTSPSRSRSRNRNKISLQDDSNLPITKNGRSNSASRNKKDGWSETDSTGSNRRSILHCDVNPYDLISSGKLHNNEFAPDNDDIFCASRISGTISKGSNKVNYSNVKAIAGQRISLGESSTQSSLINQNGETFKYDCTTSHKNGKKDERPTKQQKDNHHQHHQKNNGNRDNTKDSIPQPKRPPRRKNELSSADEDSNVPEDNPIATTKISPSLLLASSSSSSSSSAATSNTTNSSTPPTTPPTDYTLTTASLSHISTDLVTSQKQEIKSILKRPSSVTSTMSSSSDIDTKCNIENSGTNSDRVTNNNGTNKGGSGGVGSTDSRANSNNSDRQGSQFYLPLPQARKKVQFMVEDEIIIDEDQIRENENRIIRPILTRGELNNVKATGTNNNGCNSSSSSNSSANSNGDGCIIDINTHRDEQQQRIFEAQQKQQQILDILQKKQTQQKLSPIQANSLNKNLDSSYGGGVIVVLPSDRKTQMSPVAKIQPNISDKKNSSGSSKVKTFPTPNKNAARDGKTKIEIPEENTDNISHMNNSGGSPTSNGLTTANAGQTPEQLKKAFSLRRTNSDRRSNTTTVILNFNDTMALRTKNNRVDSRNIIFEDSQQSNARPKEPPPLPPPTQPQTTLPSPTSSILGQQEQENYQQLLSQETQDERECSSQEILSKCTTGAQIVTIKQGNNEPEKNMKQNQEQEQNYEAQPSRPPRHQATNLKKISWQENSTSISAAPSSSVMIKNEQLNPPPIPPLPANHVGDGIVQHEENEYYNNSNVNEEDFSFKNDTNVNVIPDINATKFIISPMEQHLKSNNYHQQQRQQQQEEHEQPNHHHHHHQHHHHHHNHQTSQHNNNKKDKLLQAQKEIYHGARLFGNHHNNQTKPASQKTVVRVAPFNKIPKEVHRLKIKHQDVNGIDDKDQKKTSILISGDDCYSTVNINNDTPIYQSSVVVTDGTMKPKQNDALKISSNTVTISVSNNPRTPEEEIIYKNNKINTLLSLNTSTSVIPIGDDGDDGGDGDNKNFITNKSSNDENSTKHKRTLITLDYDKKDDKMTSKKKKNHVDENNVFLSHEEELVKILRNPVEAVKRNLVPHVCGKIDTNLIENDIDDSHDMPSELKGNTSSQEQQKHQGNDSAITTPSTSSSSSSSSSSSTTITRYDRNSFIGKLLEDPTLHHLAEGLDSEVVAKLIENSLKRLKESRSTIDTTGTKDNDDMAKLIDISLQKIKEERMRMEAQKKHEAANIEDQESQSNRGSVSSGNSYSSANYELFEFENNESDCYQSCSSELTIEDDTHSTRSKFYQMLVDATLSEIEISTNTDDDHHYESIRLNGDPIYEEISEVPPPLPLSPPPLNNDVDLDKKNTRSMFEGASKYDILSYLVDAKERGIVREESYEYNFSNTSDIIVEEEIDTLGDLNKKQISDISSRISHLSIASDSSEDTSLTSSLSDKLSAHQRKIPSEIERNDSGVGSETSKTSRSKYQSHPAGSVVNKNSPIHLCEDCDGPVETQITDSGVMYAPLVCRKCGKKRAERKEIITEIVETEEKYGRDLQIILEEFCQPMLVAGLLTQEQLSAIFLNTEELLENNQTLAERMRDALDIAMEQGDDDLLQVNIGKLFLEATPMLHAFESYCIRQASSSLLLANLEKEKELLRIFLRVSQMENTVLRRMNLNSFLMVPVQRVTKYPLLLARLYKVTPQHLEGRELLKQAQEKIELHLNHMNQEAKDVPTKLWRRISSSSPNRRTSCEIDMINIKLRKMAIDVLEWNHDEVRFAMEGKLLYTQPTDSNWKKGRTIKLTPVNALLVTNGKPSTNYKVEKALSEQLNFPKHTGIREASLLLVKEKCGRYTLIREPLYLDRCVVCTEADWDDYFEVQEISSKDTFIFKAEDGARTKQWYGQLQYHAQGMGAWRKRRNALANIMINGMLSRT